MQIQGETSVNKLIVLYVFDQMESALSERTIVEMCTTGNNWLNYMDCMELLPRLVEDGFICRADSSEEEPLYTITKDGRESLAISILLSPKAFGMKFPLSSKITAASSAAVRNVNPTITKTKTALIPYS